MAEFIKTNTIFNNDINYLIYTHFTNSTILRTQYSTSLPIRTNQVFESLQLISVELLRRT